MAFENEPILLAIEKEFTNEKLVIMNVDANSVSFIVDDVKIDILAHQYQTLEEPTWHDNIRMYSVKDIAAMKLNAIANRGTKKDYFDIYEIMQHFTFAEVISFFEMKYASSDTYYIIRSLTYFVDADEEMDLIMIKNYKWEVVKQYIERQIATYSKSL